MYKTIDEVRSERHRLERKAEKQEKRIKSQYKELKRHPFGDSKIYAVFKTAYNFGHLIAFLKRFRRRR